MPLPLFAPTVLVGEPCPPGQRAPLAAVDHEPFGALLARFVDDRGRVAYAAWKADAAAVAALHAYLAALGRADVDAPSTREAALAFWINAYNALTLAGVLRVYPTGSIRDHTGRVFGFNIWKNLRLHAGGRTVSLAGIEHGILRGLDDPRVHFGLVCASNSCPALPRGAYTAAAVDEQLAASARAFLARPDVVRVGPDGRVEALSRLFKWYGTDFAPTTAGQLDALRPFLPADADPDRPPAVAYLPYDWSLNDQPGG
jgi:hypothetical protein